MNSSTRILVTGANGFLGSWLTRRLLRDGHHVIAFVRKTSDLGLLKNVLPEFTNLEIAYGDVTLKDTLRAAINNVDAVFHLAAVNAVRRSQAGQLFATNVCGTQNVVQVCCESGVKRLIHVSSVVSIGASRDRCLLNERSTCLTKKMKIGNFDSKRISEEIVREAADSRGLDAVIVNPSLIYGAGDARKEARQGNILVARGKLPFYTSGGVNVVAVEDVVEGLLQAWQRGKKGERYILGGENLTMKELLSAIATEAGASPPQFRLPGFLLRSLGFISDVMKLDGPLNRENALTATLYHWFDHNKAVEELGYRPGPAREAIQKSVQWMKQEGLLNGSQGEGEPDKR